MKMAEKEALTYAELFPGRTNACFVQLVLCPAITLLKTRHDEFFAVIKVSYMYTLVNS